MFLWDENKHPLTPYSSGHLHFPEKARGGGGGTKQLWLQPFLAVKVSSSFVNANSLCYFSQGLSLSATGSCTLLPSGSAAMFQTKLTSLLPALGEMVYCAFQ